MKRIIGYSILLSLLLPVLGFLLWEHGLVKTIGFMTFFVAGDMIACFAFSLIKK